MLHDFQVYPWVFGAIVYNFGGLFYAFKLPERLVKVKFDIWANSHAIFHWIVNLGAAIHLWCSIRMFHERQLFPCPEASRLL